MSKYDDIEDVLLAHGVGTEERERLRRPRSFAAVEAIIADIRRLNQEEGNV